MILMLLIVNVVTVFIGVLITQRYYSKKFDKALAGNTPVVKKVLTEPEANIIDELVRKASEFVDKYPDKWSPWGCYASNGAFTAFEFSDKKKGLKITPEGQIKYRNIHGEMKADDDTLRYVECLLPLSKKQQKTVQGLFIKLQSEHLMSMLDSFDIKAEKAKVKTEKPKTVV